jgi:trehalose synthase
MSHIQQVDVQAVDPGRFESVLSRGENEALDDVIKHGGRELRGRVIWNVNSTAKGGGVVEMLRPLLGYSRGAGIDTRWVVISGGPDFFEVTKRLHNHLHGYEGDGGELGRDQHAIYRQTLAANAAEFVPLVRPQDVVILHDPQTAGLTDAVRRTGARVMWRCHVGLDEPNDLARVAWAFLLPYLLAADAFVFSRACFAWDGLPPEKIAVIRPSIDAFSPKNALQPPDLALAILAKTGIIPHPTRDHPTFTRADGTPGLIERRAAMFEVEPVSPNDPLVTQVSRWDSLKDPLGVLRGFVSHVAEVEDAHLMLVGPSTEAVADDPEGAGVFASVRDTVVHLPDGIRRRVHLVSLPMDDIEENAAIVNALQRHSGVVVQKSLAEGFGLTVAEAMWKERAVVASRIGGIRDQIVDGKSGLLISDPRDEREFGTAVAGLLSDVSRAQAIGAAARESVQQRFLGPHHLGRFFEVVRRVLPSASAA